jgi:hypothetical protein
MGRTQRRRRAANYHRSRRDELRLQAHAAAPPPAPPAPPEVAVAVAVEPVRARTLDPSPAAVGRHAAHSHVIGYVTVPATMNESDASTSDRAIERVCERGGWQLLDIVRDPEGSSLDERSGMSRALERIEDGEASALVVSDARLLGRSLDLAEVMRRLDAAEAALVAVDLGLDTSTAQGRRVASALITMSGWGRPRPAVRVADGVTEIRGTDRWSGRLSLETHPAGTSAHNGNGARADSGNGTHTPARNSASAHTDNDASNHSDTGALARTGDEAFVHIRNGALVHEGHGISPRNGNGVITHRNNGASVHSDNSAATTTGDVVAVHSDTNNGNGASAHDENGASAHSDDTLRRHDMERVGD